MAVRSGRPVRRVNGSFARAVVCAAAALVFFGGAVHASEDDLSNMTLEQLLGLEVTSVSKRIEKRTDAAAAVYVITNEDIRRSGARTIPDVLRTVPGLAVAQLDAFKWSVSSRGFGGRFSNKLLVLIDGRSVYTPLFSGVYWEAQDVMLEDVDRIEVIRGPGGTLWGANAVNGVINIVTKPAADTQGNVVIAGTGSEELGFSSLRFGGTLANGRGYYRTYGQFLSRAPGATASGGRADDGGNMVQGGFRIDADLSLQDTLTVQGDAFDNRSNMIVNLPELNVADPVPTKDHMPFIGYNLLTRWNREVSEHSEIHLQAYFDHYALDSITNSLNYDIVDLEFDHHYIWNDTHETVWGLGGRIWWDEQDSSNYIVYLPSSATNHVFNGFIQDQITVLDDLIVTLGTKLEHNSQTGWEVQPNARVAWTPGARQTVWGSISRAVRTPSRAEEDIFLVDAAIPAGVVDPLPGLAVLIGDDDFESENLWAFEAGYRTSMAGRSALDVSGFVNRYSDLRTIEQGTPFPGPLPGFTGLPAHVVVPFNAANNLRATSYGFEVSVDFEVNAWWLVRANYSFIELDLKFKPGVIDPNSVKDEGGTPEQQVNFQNSFQLPGDVELDTIVRFVDQLPSLNVDNYVSADARIAWHPRANMEVAIVGRNLFEDEHFEFTPRFVNTSPTQVERSIYGMAKWEF